MFLNLFSKITRNYLVLIIAKNVIKIKK